MCEAAAQKQPDGEAALGRAAVLRNAALLSVCSAAAALQPWQPAAAAAAEPAAASVLPPLAPLRYSPAGPHSRLELADPQLLPLPPGPITFPRRQLELNFANEFQKKFWKLRQAEWEPYTLLHSPLRITQGNVSDSLYFDFIVFSQAAAASIAMRKGLQEFEEYSEETEAMGTVRRDPSLADNALLPGVFFEREGDRLYHGLVEGFRGVQYGGPAPAKPGASMEELLAGVQQILDIYVANGYALKASVTPGSSGGGGGSGRPTLSPVDGTSAAAGAGSSFTVKLEGPANLWSLQALAARRSTLYNQHDAAAVAAFLRASGRSSTCRLAWSDTGVVQQWTVA
ncbi:hypothetical protein COHA_010022 [Chlorella ohadii]|uniref:Uncharacterized protein n=1 Tax=Chlorella ohadii TaxID=2649997 RepID=A0AAD5DH59_9CHLO|nr:hypothetical protein COHA_010022 [Chlorella ohadii]